MSSKNTDKFTTPKPIGMTSNERQSGKPVKHTQVDALKVELAKADDVERAAFKLWREAEKVAHDLRHQLMVLIAENMKTNY